MKEIQSVGSRLREEFNKRYPCLPPVGSVIGWQKNLVGFALPSNWVECNGQVVNDVASSMNGVTLPNLNGGTRVLKGGFVAGILGTIGLKTSNAPNVNINTSSIVWIIRIK